jgi:hypothetical protein
MFQRFSTDTIDLHIAASQVAGAFNNLKKVNDYTFVPLWQEYVDTQTVVKNLWPIIDKYLKSNKNKLNCEAAVDHYELSDSVVTGILVKMVTDARVKQVQEENSIIALNR